jgi:hypothetical protein
MRTWTLLAAVTVALALPAAANAQGGSPAVCPATFEVLHDDTVGELFLPKGHYTVTLLGGSALSCAGASDLLRQFLEDWDGRLSRPWVVNSQSRSFTRGANGAVGFALAPATSGGGGGGGGHYPSGAVCPGTFRVLHDDHIGRFLVPKGQYQVTLLGVGRITCSRASVYLGRFLQDYDGILPAPWLLDRETGSFMRGSRNVGFRIKGLVGPPRPSGSGAGVHPAGKRCPGTFRVLHNDRIGKLRLRRGRYVITLRGRISCSEASAQFSRFLDEFQGTLPRPWSLAVQTATFTRGAGSNTEFRVKPTA